MNQTFGFQESLKEMFPDKNEFLRMPKLLEEQERLKEFIGILVEDGQPLDREFAKFVESVDVDKFYNDYYGQLDVPHPTEAGRTFLGDLGAKMQVLTAKAQGQTESERAKLAA